MSTAQLLFLLESDYEGQDLPTEAELTSAIEDIQGRTDNFYNEIVNEVIERLREGEYKEDSNV
jgi:hypothetical protein